MSFGPCNFSLKIWDVHRNSNSQNGSPFESVWVHSCTLSYTPKNMKCDFQASLLARTFASPCLGCNPKARVATNHVYSYVITIGTTFATQLLNLVPKLVILVLFEL